MSNEVYLSKEALQKLKDELEERSNKRRIELSRMIEKALEHGDLKENAEYHAAKDEQAKNAARVRQLEEIIKNAKITEKSSSDTIEPGSVVDIDIDGDVSTYLLGSIEESDDEYEILSTSSPLGQKLLGKKVGETTTYDGPKRTFNVKIISINSK
jgi:transcription elongation factor GreA